MKWTAHKVAMLRELAPTGLGVALVASRLETTPKAVYQKARKLGIRVAVNKSILGAPPNRNGLRARWAELIGPMKDALRADISSE